MGLWRWRGDGGRRRHLCTTRRGRLVVENTTFHGNTAIGGDGGGSGGQGFQSASDGGGGGGGWMVRAESTAGAEIGIILVRHLAGAEVVVAKAMGQMEAIPDTKVHQAAEVAAHSEVCSVAEGQSQAGGFACGGKGGRCGYRTQFSRSAGADAPCPGRRGRRWRRRISRWARGDQP